MDADAAYTQIKKLEASGAITIPETQATVTVGTINPRTGAFTWTVPTLSQTTTLPPPASSAAGSVPAGPPSLPGATVRLANLAGTHAARTPGQEAPPPGPGGENTIVTRTVGVASTTAVDLLLRFDIVPLLLPEGIPVTSVEVATTTGPTITAVTPAASLGRAADAGRSLLTAVPATAPATAPATISQTNGGTTITGFPTVVSAADHIIVDAGLVYSVPGNTPYVTPDVSTFDLLINIPGHDPIDVRVMILRPPVIGLGAFTIEALPVTIVYAPPQGAAKKNFVTYTGTSTVTRTMTTAVTQATSTKVAPAYTPAQLMAKVGSAIGEVAALVGTGGGAAAAPSILGGLSEIVGAISGPVQDATDSTADATKQLSSSASAMGDILDAVDSSAPPSQTTTVSTETDNSVSVTTSLVDTWVSGGDISGELPSGIGDRIVYIPNVRVAWAAVNGELALSIIGFTDIPTANAVQDLIAAEQAILAGQTPLIDLQLATIRSLLALDPLTPRPPSNVSGAVVAAPPLIAAPRFVPAAQQGGGGSSTGNNQADKTTITVDTSVDQRQVSINSQVNITDMKPGWGAVLFGADDNDQTTTTTTLTNTQTIDNKTDTAVSCTVNTYSESAADPYSFLAFTDLLLQTFLFVEPDAPQLTGTPGTAV